MHAIATLTDVHAIATLDRGRLREGYSGGEFLPSPYDSRLRGAVLSADSAASCSVPTWRRPWRRPTAQSRLGGGLLLSADLEEACCTVSSRRPAAQCRLGGGLLHSVQSEACCSVPTWRRPVAQCPVGGLSMDTLRACNPRLAKARCFVVRTPVVWS